MRKARMVSGVCLFAVTLAGGIAVAQPAPPPPPPPGPAPAPAPPPMQPQPPPPPGYPPAGYQPAAYQPPPPPPGPIRDGFTVGVDIGFGFTTFSGDTEADSEAGLSGLNLSLGGFINPKLAVLFRLSGTSFWLDTGFDESIQFSNIFVGGQVQYYAMPQLFVGGGAGLGVFGAFFEDESDSTNGFAVNARVGYDVSQSSGSAWQVALEITPSFYSEDGFDLTATSIGLQIGYQSF
jgi:hypothetical protein